MANIKVKYPKRCKTEVIKYGKSPEENKDIIIIKIWYIGIYLRETKRWCL